MDRRDFYRARRTIFRGFVIAAWVASVVTLMPRLEVAASQDGQAAAAAQMESAQTKLHVVDLFAKQPLSFERNDGQTDAQVKFISRGDRYKLFLTASEAVLALRTPHKDSGKPEKVESEILRLKLIGANPGARIEAVDQLGSKSNYFVGKDPRTWHTNIPAYARVNYRNVYSGIDLVYYGASQRELEYDFVIAPGADPKVIGIRIEGARALTFNRDGDLILHLADGGEVVHHAPVIYQERNGKREKVDGRSVIKGKNAIGFELAAYDHTRSVFIDPGLSYSTYLGGNGGDSGQAIAVDSSGFAKMAHS